MTSTTKNILGAVIGAGGTLALALAGWVAASPPATYEGRPIADVMGWQGARWLEREGRAQEEATAALVRELGVAPGDVVVDLGCGSGFHARRLAARVKPGGVVYCVDLQPEMLVIAERLAVEAGLDNVRFVKGQPDRVPLPDGSADLLLMVDVYHELADPAGVLADLRRVLAPDGQVALVEFRREGNSAAHIKVDHRMSAAQIRREWTGAGFAVARRFDGLPSQHLFFMKVAVAPTSGVQP